MVSSPPLPAEDQTDEAFFDRLEEDDFGVTTLHKESNKMNEALLGTGTLGDGMQLKDLDDTRVAYAQEDRLENKDIVASLILEKESLISEGSSSGKSWDAFPMNDEAVTIVSEEKDEGAESSCVLPEAGLGGLTEIKSAVRSLDLAVEGSGGSKNTGVKEVQWSSFYTDSLQFSLGGVEPFSDFLIENSDNPTNQVNLNDDQKSSFINRAVPNHEMDQVSSEQTATYFYGTVNEFSTDVNGTNHWENLYPGWKFDALTGQWYQVDNNDTTAHLDSCDASTVNAQASLRDHHITDGKEFISGDTTEFSYSQQSSSLIVGSISEDCKTNKVSSWNQYSQDSNGYPSNMVLDPQYPGWYFDTNSQQWLTLDAYTQSIQQTSPSFQSPLIGDMNACNGFIGERSSNFFGGVCSLEHNDMQGPGNQNMVNSLDALTNKFAQHNITQYDAKDTNKMSISGNQQTLTFNDTKMHETSYPFQQTGFNSWNAVQTSAEFNYKNPAGFQNYVPAEGVPQFNPPKIGQSMQSHFSQSFYNDQNSVKYHEQNFHNSSYPHTSYLGNKGRSSDGRPPHALVTFGFGGKLVVMKSLNTMGMKMGYDNEESSEAVVFILGIMDVVKDQQADIAEHYFHSLLQHSFPGPLVGGNCATKDVYKWINESVTNCESPLVDPKNGRMMKLLLSLLKISCQHYGKLRSPFGSGASLEDNDGPESSVAKLFASARAGGYLTRCMQSIPSEAHIQATSIEMQNLLVSGKRTEALQCAQVGQLWGPALVLAAQLGEKFYVDTVKQMAQSLLISGSPLRTLCLLIAGQPADVFSFGSSTNDSYFGTAKGYEHPSEIQSNCMLDDWEENMAIIAANRTNDDELVVIHLGDCLWKERGEVTAAHCCYLAAESNIEPYSDSARLCLIGADHCKYPRTYASPDAIQRTELYEYAKVLGNSQFVLLPFQPYKLLYANMLAEIGKTSDSLRYCQAAIKLLKNSTRTPEVEMLKSLFSSLEDRLSFHQQGGYGENLAPAKLVGKLFTSIDRSIHRMMGAPSSLPPMPPNYVNGIESNIVAAKVVSSQSTMVMSSLVPSASINGMSEWTSDTTTKVLHNRSISEPDFGRTPKQNALNDGSAGSIQSKTSPSRFGRFSSQLFQKTIGLVSRARPDRQAKLGESNKFYYDEKLKRWVEEGAAPPTEEAALPPPPKAEYNISNALKSRSFGSPDGGPDTKLAAPMDNSGFPPRPPSPNQFSARRMGVRSRYVDTFNKGSSNSPANSFQSPLDPAVKPSSAPKFFVPTAIPTSEEQAPADPSIDSPTPHSSSTIEKSASMNSIGLPLKNKEAKASPNMSRPRAASWSGSSWDCGGAKFGEDGLPLGFGIAASSPSSFLPSSTNPDHSGSLSQRFNGDDLDEVELS